VLDICTGRIEDSTGSCTEVSHIWTAFWAGKLVVSSVIPSDGARKKKRKERKQRKKKKTIKFHKLFVLKYIFSVSDPQLFYGVESLKL
jgi:hypothetical protein